MRYSFMILIVLFMPGAASVSAPAAMTVSSAGEAVRIDLAASAAGEAVPFYSASGADGEGGISELDFHTDPPADEVVKVKWEDLADVEWIWENEFYQVKFGEPAQRLDGKEVLVEGFMFPLEYTRTHTTFLVSASPMTNCFFCGPGEAESMILINAVDEVEYLYTPIRLQGTFKLVHDASMGIIYEMDDVKWVEE